MTISIFDMFRVGVGPSSSHTVGPMRAARKFANHLVENGLLDKVHRLQIDLLGSLAATGIGHSTDQAVLLGLMLESPSEVDIDSIPSTIKSIKENKIINLAKQHEVKFDYDTDLVFKPTVEDPYHTNTLLFKAFDKQGNILLQEKIYSVGGGFIETEEEAKAENKKLSYTMDKEPVSVPYPYSTARELINLCKKHNKTIAELVRENELSRKSNEEIDKQLDYIASVMDECLQRGLRNSEVLPGPLKVKRRAKTLFEKLKNSRLSLDQDPLQIIDWINAFALAVSEENAAGGRVVTAPTNGAAGVIPAVLAYYRTFVKGSSQEGIRNFLLTAGAIGALYKTNASISGAEVGCQGEIGVACSMAAAGLAAALGATNNQIENAAEIAMEHHLGLTCDPVAGQVQIPCIERNAVSAVKAVNSVRLAVQGDGSHYISLDQVIKTMLATGKDMKTKYKETSLGGLAVCIVEC